jgi:hypothetical protein
MIVIETAMLPVSRVTQRRLLAGFAAFMLSAVPLSAAADSAASGPDVDALWNQPQGVRVDSAFYVIQQWWDGLSRVAQNDPTQRGLDELAQANADLLNAYTLLQEKRTDPGPHPVAVIDPLLSGIYNFVTGSRTKAPVGSALDWANRSLLKLEGRGGTDTIIRELLTDYQIRQAAAARDLSLKPAADTPALMSANAARETALLAKIKGMAMPGDGLTAGLDAADHTTALVAAKHQANGNGQAKADAKHGAGNGHDATPPGKGQGQKK